MKELWQRIDFVPDKFELLDANDMILTKSQIEDQLNIEGYSIELPCTWDSYGHAQSCICLCQ